MPLKVYVLFFSVKWWVSRVIRLISNADYDHCSILVIKENDDALLATIYEKSKAKFRDPRTALSHAQLKAGFYIGEFDESKLKQMKEVMKKPVYFQRHRIILWYFILRWFTNYKPEGCCTIITCKMLRICGLDIDDYIRPTMLFKELKNADNFISWSSGGR